MQRFMQQYLNPNSLPGKEGILDMDQSRQVPHLAFLLVIPFPWNVPCLFFL